MNNAPRNRLEIELAFGLLSIPIWSDVTRDRRLRTRRFGASCAQARGEQERSWRAVIAPQPRLKRAIRHLERLSFNSPSFTPPPSPRSPDFQQRRRLSSDGRRANEKTTRHGDSLRTAGGLDWELYNKEHGVQDSSWTCSTAAPKGPDLYSFIYTHSSSGLIHLLRQHDALDRFVRAPRLRGCS